MMLQAKPNAGGRQVPQWARLLWPSGGRGERLIVCNAPLHHHRYIKKCDIL
jgi:hypothetical protein